MATISKFYLHDAATSNTGTMPAGAFLGSDDATGDATGARTARTANATIGALQTSSTITSTADQNLQKWGHRRFVSSPLAAQTISLSTTGWAFSYARAESSLNHNLSMLACIYPWRPTTGARVGTGFQRVYCVGTEPTVITTQQAESVASITGGVDQAILDGDILVIEVHAEFTQSHSSAFTDTFYYDGTTEASTTSCASFVTPPSALTLFGGGTTYTKAGYAKESA